MSQTKAKEKAGKVKAPKATGDKKRIQTAGIILAVFFVLVIALGLAVSNDWFTGFGPACEVGDVEVSQDEYQFNFYSNYTAYISQYSNYLSSIGLDTNKPLSSQNYSEDLTWQEYFDQQTFQGLQDTIGLATEAEKKGIALDEENQEQVETYVTNLKSAAKESNLGFGAYTKHTYGRKLNETDVRLALGHILLADQYSEYLYNSYEISDDEIDTYYSENPEDFDTVNYRVITVDADIPDQGEESDDEYADITAAALKAAKAKAEELKALITDEITFKKVANDYAAEIAKESDENTEAENTDAASDASYKSAVGYDAVGDSDGADWLFSDDRKAKDISVIEETEGYSIYMFIERELDIYNTVNVRHILIPFNEEFAAAASTAEDNAAKVQAQSLLKQFENEGATEDVFAEIAMQEGTDSTAADGGLLEKVVKGQMVDGFDDWIFAANRKAGDYDMVKTEFGYHLVYFIGYGEESWRVNIDTVIRKEKYTADYDELMSKYSVYVDGELYYAYEPESAS